jgi:hypothetical protein
MQDKLENYNATGDVILSPVLSLIQASSLNQVKLLDIRVPDHGGGPLSVEGGVLLGSSQE